MKREIRINERGVNGITEQDDSGAVYWMGSKVHPCPMCGIAVTNVDHCGEFGNPECPTFGIGREAYEECFVQPTTPESGGSGDE